MKMNQPCDGMLSLRDSPIDLSPYPAQSAWTLTGNDEAMRHSMPDRVTHTVQAFDCPDIDNRSAKRGLLVRGRDDAAASTSRIYWLPEMIDMMLGTEVEGSFSRFEPGLNLIGLLAADYKSDVQGVRGYQAPRHGSCVSAEYSKCHTIWTFTSLEDRYKLLNSIGSWALWYCVTTSDLSVKRKPFPHRHGMADLFFWVHEGSGTAALTFRMRNPRPQKPCWITGRLPREDPSESYGDSKASVKLISYQEGGMLHLNSMQASSPERTQISGAHHSPKGSREKVITIQFRSAADKILFKQSVIRYQTHHDSDNVTGFQLPFTAERSTQDRYSLDLSSTNSSSRQS
ncbi:hypothetical protein WHR41_02894 [Cladosporium halotolerans]|uniref:Uncharacterized protein n=1 Tax=Cladosporium halotolerans TaxID=1052096 RepID=A0AB34KXB3_9PEZI